MKIIIGIPLKRRYYILSITIHFCLRWIVARMMILSGLPPWAINLTICTLTAVLTQVASNTATANVLLPILADMALTICVNPIYLIMSAALTSSYAFMLPVRIMWFIIFYLNFLLHIIFNMLIIR